MDDLPYFLGTNQLRTQYYLLPPDELILLDWLIIKAFYFNFDSFYYSYNRIIQETRINRRRLTAILTKFESIGLIKTYVGGNADARTRVTHFHVLFEGIKANLPQIIDPDKGKEYYRGWLDRLNNAIKKNRSVKKDGFRKHKGQTVWERLNETYNRRRRMYNDGEITGEKPERILTETVLPGSSRHFNALADLQDLGYNEEAINNAFISFTDDTLKGNVKPANLLDYFLKFENDHYPVLDRYLSYFNTSYSIR